MRLDWFSDHLEWAEGRRRFAYEDSVGVVTVGVGRNLEDVGLSDDEIDLLKSNDMQRAISDAQGLEYWDLLNDARKVVVADLCFNLGITRFKGFIRTNEALACGDWETAADELIDSKYYRQTGRRAKRNVNVMRTGEWV